MKTIVVLVCPSLERLGSPYECRKPSTGRRPRCNSLCKNFLTPWKTDFPYNTNYLGTFRSCQIYGLNCRILRISCCAAWPVCYWSSLSQASIWPWKGTPEYSFRFSLPALLFPKLSIRNLFFHRYLSKIFYSKQVRVLPAWCVDAISMPNNQFIGNTQIDIHASILYPLDMEVHSSIFKLMNFSERLLPWTLHGYLNNPRMFSTTNLSGFHGPWKFCVFNFFLKKP